MRAIWESQYRTICFVKLKRKLECSRDFFSSLRIKCLLVQELIERNCNLGYFETSSEKLSAPANFGIECDWLAANESEAELQRLCQAFLKLHNDQLSMVCFEAYCKGTKVSHSPFETTVIIKFNCIAIGKKDLVFHLFFDKEFYSEIHFVLSHLNFEL